MALDKEVSTVILRLHQGLGVRESGLARALASTVVARRWHISGEDHLIRVRAKVIYRLDVAFGAMGPTEREVWPAIYNAARDLTLQDKDLGDRKRELPRLYPGLRVRGGSADRCIKLLSDELIQHTTYATHDDFDEVALDSLVRGEEAFAASIKLAGRAGDFKRLVAAAHEPPTRAPQQAFLEQRIVTPVRQWQSATARPRSGSSAR